MKRLTRDKRVPCNMRYKVFDPVIEINPGETLVVETINHMTPIVRSEADLHAHRSPGYREREETGPIYVRGAKPGDALAIHIENIDIVGFPHTHGSGPLADIYPQQPMLFPVEGDHYKLPRGLKVPLSKMIGDIYTTPPSPMSSCADCGGNMDFTDVKPGSTLYLPVFREGGLLVLGDVHAFQGEGELYAEGGETAADVTITIDIDRRFPLARPMVETDDAFICLACRETLFDSLRLAMQDAVEISAQYYGISKNDSYIFCATSGSIRLGGALCNRKNTERDVLVGLSFPKGCRAE